MNRKIYLLVVFLTLIGSSRCFSTKYPKLPLKFEQISLQQGLSQSMVHCILQDKNGFMWFGTQDGLNKYDGYTFTIYKNIPFEQTSLSFNEVTCLFEDSKGNLWVGTSRGLNRFIPSENQFEKFFNIIYNEESGGQGYIKSIQEDEDGNIIVGTFDGVRVLSPAPFCRNSAYFVSKSYKYDKNDPSTLNSNYVHSIIKDKKGFLWVLTHEGPNKMLEKHHGQHEFENERNSCKKIFSSLSGMGKKGNYMHVDNKGNIWAASSNGLMILDEKNDQFIQPKFFQRETDNFKIPEIVSIFCMEGETWAFSLQEGLIKIKYSKDYEIEFIEKFKQNTPQSHFDQTVVSFYENPSRKEHILWIGTSGMGAYKVYKKGNFFTKYNKEDGIPANHVSSVLKDEKGLLWIGTDNGLSRLDRKTGKIKNYFSSKNTGLTSNQISKIFQDKRKNIWIGTKHGLNLYDSVKDNFKPIYFSKPDMPFTDVRAKHNFCGDIFEDSKQNIWFGTGRGVKILDTKKGIFQYYSYKANEPASILPGVIYSINEDKEGAVWIGTSSGLCKYNSSSHNFTKFFHDPTNQTTLPSNVILCLASTGKGQFWVGTSQGLSRMINENGRVKFENITVKDGLINNYVYGILEDKFGNLWLSTNGGICKFDPVKRTFRNYHVNDGLQSLEFNSGAYYKAKDGELFFGGIAGLNSFFPEAEPINKHVPDVFISKVFLYDHQISLDSSVVNKKLCLKHNQNFLQFEFSALDFKNPEANQYAYKLEGLNEDWINIKNRRFASFNNLPPNEYTLKLKASNDGGIWSKEIIAMKITIRPPFYQTLWFYLIVVAAIIITIILTHNYLVHLRVKRVMMIEKIRTEEHEKIRKKTAEDFHDELGNKLTRISVLAELAKSKVHSQNEDISLLISKISDNANTLFYGTKDLIWSINPKNDSFYELAIRLKDFGDDLFDNTNITFKTKGFSDDIKKISLPMDMGRHVVLIFKEAMTNALKHSHAKNITLSFTNEGEEISIELSDDGRGFENEIDYDGNGLSNMRNRAKKINARLYINSRYMKGTTIKLYSSVAQIVVQDIQ